jgi:DNA-binding MarR family transcriptional regulator
VPERPREITDAATSEQVAAVMLAAQTLVGIAAQSAIAVEHRVTLPQLRILTLVSGRGPLNLLALAQAMDVHPSNATRAVDRLVAAGLLRRAESPVDRRNQILELTGDGRALIESVIEHRRVAVAEVLARMPENRRKGLAAAMRSFGQAAGEKAVDDAWRLGWSD